MKSPSIDTDTEMTQIIELVEKDIKTVITIFFHIKKVKKKLSILSGDMKDQDWTSRGEKYNVWDEKHTGWDEEQIGHFREEGR